jgi:hypothetical protein
MRLEPIVSSPREGMDPGEKIIRKTVLADDSGSSLLSRDYTDLQKGNYTLQPSTYIVGIVPVKNRPVREPSPARRMQKAVANDRLETCTA